MALQTAFEELHFRLLRLREALNALRLTIAEDRPMHGDAALVETFSNAADDLLGGLDEALAAASVARAATTYPADVHKVRWALTTCQDRCNNVTQRLSTEFMAYEPVAGLMRLGAERLGKWPAWSQSVKVGIEACHQPLYDVNQALFVCWQEIAERIGMTSVSLAAHNVETQVHIARTP